MTEGYYKDFGWANGWNKDPEIIAKCKKLKHKQIEINRDKPFGCLHTEVMCHLCKYIYHYDSS